MIFVTGDTHSDFRRFSTNNFPQQKEMTKADVVIICGDFGGVWKDGSDERYWLDWLNDKSFTTLFVDGNHENFDRLYSDEFSKIEYCGGTVTQIRDSILHLNRGEVYQIQGYKFFAFGGASSHDIKDGIVDLKDYSSSKDAMRELKKMRSQGKQFRVKGVSWWPQEIPSMAEMEHGKQKLSKNNNSVDFVISHCLPQEVAAVFLMGLYQSDLLTMYFNGILHDGLKFIHWYCGHYHIDRRIMGKFDVLYENIVRIV